MENNLFGKKSEEETCADADHGQHLMLRRSYRGQRVVVRIQDTVENKGMLHEMLKHIRYASYRYAVRV